MRINDAVTGFFIIILSSFIIYEAKSLPALPGVPYGPGLFPTLIAYMMMLGGVILIFKGLKTLGVKGWYELDEWARRRNSYITLALIFSVLLFYILFSEMLGFILTSILILLAMLLWTRGKRHFLSSVIISVCFSIIIFFIFGKIMRIPLPAGVLQGFI
ncbi:MAG: tripartite tricarboxylate transporter TctB family protein [Bacteroidales bacterium]